AEEMIADAHALGLRVILDIVPNHTSDEHAWFTAALASDPGSAERDRYWFRPGRGPDGARPPNDWRSVFGGPAWTRVLDDARVPGSTYPDGSSPGAPGEWYLHLFAPEQPDLNWGNREVRKEFEDILRFWFDRGVDGFRIDVAHGLVKHAGLPDIGLDEEELLAEPDIADHPHWDRDAVHDIYRGWRQVADSYAGTEQGPRVFVAEAWVRTEPNRLARYLRPDELHTAFNFDFLKCSWNAAELRASIKHNLRALAEVDAPATWVLSNHDVLRHVTRYGRADGDDHKPSGSVGCDLARGVRRARAAALLMLALPGGAYVYQGDELALPEVEDLPTEVLQDPIWLRTGGEFRGRDGCRVPLPWTGEQPALGFGPTAPWLPQPTAWNKLSVEAQTGDADSTLELYRAALALRRSLPALAAADMRWDDDVVDGVLSFGRGAAFRCVVNLGEHDVPLPEHDKVLLASAPLGPHSPDTLPGDTAVWLAMS
ncbi:MAG TPA: alpha-amylase family glycosyl hydrolase, partial [Actinopolymorphaceae bacterium]|nr:alpha-amylase family glycosyl hydrolase [Actinopolymorphaceae bacterium]